MPKDDVSLLNLEQQQAVEYNAGPLLIVAGAGTGKTTVVTEKVKYIINNKLATPEQILALTFTEKAALEMEERIDKALPYGYFQMWVSTFHGFADKILREELVHIGLNPGYKLLTQAESIIFLRSNLFLFDLKYFRPLGNPNKFIEAILQHFSRLKDEDIDPDSYMYFVKTQEKNERIPKEEKEKAIELAKAYIRYQDLKVKADLFDFSDLIYYLLKLFRERKSILQKYQQMFRFALVDEFQDTNIAQYSLIKLLCPPEKNPMLTVVGDDSQAIYKFRGASVSNIMSFMKDYAKSKQITLLKNYRSSQNILDASYQLIKHNDPDTLEAQLGISKALVAAKKKALLKEALSFNLSTHVEEEAGFVVNEISKLVPKYQYSDLAILVRANNHAQAFIRALTQKGIPYQFLGPAMLFKQPEVKDLIAYLKLLYNLEDSPALYRVLSMDIFKLDKKDLSFLLQFGKKINRPLFQAIEIYLSFFEKDLYKDDFAIYIKYLPLLKQESRSTLLFLYKIILRHLSLIHKETAGQILFYFLEDTHYLNKFTEVKTEQEEKIVANISKFFNKLKAFEFEHEDASVNAVVDYIEMCLELGESPRAEDLDFANINAVNILTTHSAKGLEFSVVFLINLSKGRFPTTEKKETIPIPEKLIKEILPEGDYHLEEERRLFYVGLTRAMDKVYLTCSSFYEGGKRERKISPFISETLGEETLQKILQNKTLEKKQLTIFDYKSNEVAPQNKPMVREKIPLSYFSYSQFETFATCPLRYKYQYVLKIPSLTNASASFGETIHKTLQKYYQEFLVNREVKLERLLEVYKSCWIPVGYSSQAHGQKTYQEGELILTNFYNTLHKQQLKIVDLEKFFKVKIGNDITIAGKIDRVDLKDNGEIEIIDYKTGKKPTEAELKKSLQLSIYALAATDRGLYQKNLNQVTLSFYYLKDMGVFSMKKSQFEIESLKDDIKKTVETMRGNDFTPKVGYWCEYCPFQIICEARQ